MLTRHQWQQLAPDQQALVKETVKNYALKATASIRQYEQKALSLLEVSGIEDISLSPGDISHLQQRSEQLRQELNCGVGRTGVMAVFARAEYSAFAHYLYAGPQFGIA